MASALAFLPLATLLVALPAHAQTLEKAPNQSVPPAPSVDSHSLQPSETTHWYGWQTALVDASAVALLLPAAAVQSDSARLTLVTLSVSGYMLGAPFVHALHHNPGRAAGSLGLRFGAPLAGIVVGALLENCHNDDLFCGLNGAAVGGLVGTISAMVIDSAALARETVRESPKLLPIVSRTKDATWLGVVGRF